MARTGLSVARRMGWLLRSLSKFCGPINLAGIGHIALLVGATLAISWVGSASSEIAHRIWAGEPLDWTMVLVWPVGASQLMTLPIMAGVMLLDRVAGAGPRFSLMEGFVQRRYDLLFVLADATGATRWIQVLLSFGLSAGLASLLEFDAGISVFSKLPLYLQAPIVYMIGTFIQYWLHRFRHLPLMWPLHAMHHASKDLTALSDSRGHPLDDLNIVSLAAIASLGFNPDAVFVAAFFAQVQAAVAHSNAPFPLWLERWALCGPRLHHLHHASAPEYHETNFSQLVWWDQLFGTYLLVPNARDVATGIQDPRYDTGRPLHDLASATMIWLGGMRRAGANMIAAIARLARGVRPEAMR